MTKLGHSILLAESNIHHVPEYADRLYVIERGEIIFAGKPHEAWQDPAVLRVIGGAAAPVAGLPPDAPEEVPRS